MCDGCYEKFRRDQANKDIDLCQFCWRDIDDDEKRQNLKLRFKVRNCAKNWLLKIIRATRTIVTTSIVTNAIVNLDPGHRSTWGGCSAESATIKPRFLYVERAEGQSKAELCELLKRFDLLMLT